MDSLLGATTVHVTNIMTIVARTLEDHICFTMLRLFRLRDDGLLACIITVVMFEMPHSYVRLIDAPMPFDAEMARMSAPFFNARECEERPPFRDD